MKTRMILDGIITAMNIPFEDNGALDEESLRRQVINGLDSGVVGFMVPVFASEVGRLSSAERERIVATVVECADGRVPVIGGTTAATQADSLSLGKMCLQRGCAGILCSIPYENDRQYRAYAHALAALEPEFLMIQDWAPGSYGVSLDLLVDLFEELPCFRCLKVEVVPAGPKYSELLRRTGGLLHLSGGWSVSQMIEALDRGVHAFALTAMSEVYCRIVALYHAGDRARAKKLFERILPAIVFSTQHLDISISFYKRLIWKQGLYKTPCVRQPLMAFDEYHRRCGDEQIELVMTVTEEIKSGLWN